MKFSALDRLHLRCLYEQFIPGELHEDGRRYLPNIIVTPLNAGPDTPPGARLWLVDRHHRVDPTLVGRTTTMRLLCALSTIRLQTPPFRAGFVPPPGNLPDQPLSDPVIYGQIAEVLTWEVQRAQLPFETLYTELVINVGEAATIGLRTTLSAPRIASLIGRERLTSGDWVEINRSRIDILACLCQGGEITTDG